MQDANLELKKTSLLEELDGLISEDAKQIEALGKRKEKNEALRKALRESLGVTSQTSNTGYGSKVQIVQKIIDLLPKAQFTQNDIEFEMLRTNPEAEINRDRIRAVIWSLAKKHKTIKLIRKGNNRQPAEFERLSSPANGSSESGNLKIPQRKFPIPPPRSAPVADVKL